MGGRSLHAKVQVSELQNTVRTTTEYLTLPKA